MRFPAPETVTGPAQTARVATHRFATCLTGEDGRATCQARAPDGSLGASIEIANVRRVVVGNHHACAVTTSDELWCFGANESGQSLGNVLPASVSKPTKVMSSATDVAVGLRHTCALTQDGRIVCFGDNSRGQLGLRGEKDALGLPRVPELSQAVKQIIAGYDQTCALTESGRVWCWGARASQNGEMRTITGFTSSVRQLAASGHRTCALLDNGTVACWLDSATAAELVRGSEGSVELAVGDLHACARTRGGSVRCWGSNVLGQLGRDLPARRVEVRPPHSCLQVEYSIDSESATPVEVAW